MKAIRLTGEHTYVYRREIRRAGGVWNYELMGWIFPAGKEVVARELANVHDLVTDEVEVADDTFEPLEGERLREYRQEKNNRKAEKLIKWADSREKKADQLLHKHDHYTKDYSFVTQPILVGHHSENRHRKLLNRIRTDIDTGYGLQSEADKLRQRAESLTAPVAVKGDAAKRRAERLAFNRSKIKIGDRVYNGITGWGVIEKINQKTYKTVGYTYLHSIEFIHLDRGVE